MARKAKPKLIKAGCPLWMVTFGDAMSLLVTFFVMLIAFSTLEEAMLADLLGVLRGAMGVAEVRGGEGITERHVLEDADPAGFAEVTHAIRIQGLAEDLLYLTEEEMSDMLPQFVDHIRFEIHDSIADRLLIQMLDGGLSIIMQTSAIFKPGTLEWAEDFSSLWRSIAWMLQGRDNDVRITAVLCASALVPREVAATAWGFGIARSDIIARELQKTMRADPRRFGLGAQVHIPEDGKTEGADHFEIMIMGEHSLLNGALETVQPMRTWR